MLSPIDRCGSYFEFVQIWVISFDYFFVSLADPLFTEMGSGKEITAFAPEILRTGSYSWLVSSVSFGFAVVFAVNANCHDETDG